MSKAAFNKIHTGLREALEYAKADSARQCFCVGPQPGERRCPCQIEASHKDQMRGLEKLNEAISGTGDEDHFEDCQAERIVSKAWPLKDVRRPRKVV